MRQRDEVRRRRWGWGDGGAGRRTRWAEAAAWAMAHRYLLLARGGCRRRGLPGVLLQQLLCGRGLLGARPCLAQVRGRARAQPAAPPPLGRKHGGWGRREGVSVAMVTRGAAPPLPGTPGRGGAPRCPRPSPARLHPLRRRRPPACSVPALPGGGERGPVDGRECGASWPGNGNQAPCGSTRGHRGLLRPPERPEESLSCRRRMRRHPRAAAAAAPRRYRRVPGGFSSDAFHLTQKYLRCFFRAMMRGRWVCAWLHMASALWAERFVWGFGSSVREG